MLKQRLPLILSATALVVALFGSTPLGSAAGRLVSTIPPFAKKSAYADVAGNALQLNGHKASVSGLPGTIPLLNARGKLPAVIGALGPAGPAGQAGPQGAQGPQGATGLRGPAGPVDTSKLLGRTLVVATSHIENGSVDTESVSCPTGYEAVGGGAYTGDGSVVTSGSWPLVSGGGLDGLPDGTSGPPTGWVTRVSTPGLTPAKNVLVRWTADCAKEGA